MAIHTAYIVAPVFTATEVVAFFLARVAGETSLRYLFRRFILKRNDLFRIALFGVSFARPVTGLATGYLSFPTANVCQLGMRSVGKGFELIFVAILAGFATDVVCRAIGCRFGLNRRDGLRMTPGGKPDESNRQRTAKEQRLDDSVWTQRSASSCSARCKVAPRAKTDNLTLLTYPWNCRKRSGDEK